MHEERSPLGRSRNGGTAKAVDASAAAGDQTPNRRGTIHRGRRKTNEMLSGSGVQSDIQRIQNPSSAPDPMVAEYEEAVRKLDKEIKSLQGRKEETEIARLLFQLRAMKKDAVFALKILRRDTGWTREMFYRRSKCGVCGKSFCKHFDLED